MTKEDFDAPRVGAIGPGGGYIFYDKGYYSSGWRYLEAAPAGWSGTSSDPGHRFGFYRTTMTGRNLIVGTGIETDFGGGKACTSALVSAMKNDAYLAGYISTSDYAAKICAEYRGGGFDDWFLPNLNELSSMLTTLKWNNLGGFSDFYYWSSSEAGADNAWAYFASAGIGSQSQASRLYNYSVRPVRAF